MSLMAWLAIVGALVLAGVVVHGAWTARRTGPRRAELSPRTDPTLNPAAPAAVPQPELRIAAPRRAARLDALIDAIAGLTLESPISAEAALLHMPASRRAGSKPFFIEGLHSEGGHWEQPTPGQRYSEFQAGVQLANRAGALNEIEYSEFVQKVQAFADAIGAMVDAPDMLDVVSRARELDGFAQSHDGQLALVLRARAAAWTVGYIHQAAARHGLVPGVVPGRLVLPSANEGAPPLLVLTFDAQAALAEDPHISALRELTLWLDVPQTGQLHEPYPAWHRVAHGLAADIEADITDERGQPVPVAAFASIAQDLQVLYAALAARDLAAGSSAARRLFS